MSWHIRHGFPVTPVGIEIVLPQLLVSVLGADDMSPKGAPTQTLL